MARQIEMDVRRSQSPSRHASKVISVLFHIMILIVMGSVSMQLVQEEEKERTPEKVMEATLIRIPPTREPPGSESGAGTPVDDKPKSVRPKALARRTLTSNVSQYKNIVQQQVTRVQPTPVLGEAVAKVNVSPVVKTAAPKAITQSRIQTRVVDALGDVQPYQVSAAPAASNTKLREAPTLSQTAGPRVQSAAGPVVGTSALSYQQPTITEGVVGDVTVQGDADGPNIRVMEPGSGSGYFDGAGGQGSGSGGGDGNGTGGSGTGTGRGTGRGTGDGSGSAAKRDCATDLQCRAYLEMIRQRVYGRWAPEDDVPGGGVQLSFRVDRSGAAHEIVVVKSANGELGDSCVTAFRHANPFPPPPASIAYLLEKKIIATFDFSRGGKGG